MIRVRETKSGQAYVISRFDDILHERRGWLMVTKRELEALREILNRMCEEQ